PAPKVNPLLTVMRSTLLVLRKSKFKVAPLLSVSGPVRVRRPTEPTPPGLRVPVPLIARLPPKFVLAPVLRTAAEALPTVTAVAPRERVTLRVPALTEVAPP